MKSQFNTVILGCGYVGSAYLQKNQQSYATKTRFQNEKSNIIYFNLRDKLSWKNIPDVQKVLWTFAAATEEVDLQLAKEFYASNLKNKNVIVLSTTSAYQLAFENEFINENSTLKLNEPRFLAEELLRKDGALVLHLSGIIGPNRTPLMWYKKNLVRYGKNILNYIHIQDIVFFIEKLFENFQAKERFNLTSADYKTHHMILNWLKEKSLIDQNYYFMNNEECINSKKVENEKILEFLKLYEYNFMKYPEHVEYNSHE